MKIVNKRVNEKIITEESIIDDITKNQRAKIVSTEREEINNKNSNNKRINKVKITKIEYIYSNIGNELNIIKDNIIGDIIKSMIFILNNKLIILILLYSLLQRLLFNKKSLYDNYISYKALNVILQFDSSNFDPSQIIRLNTSYNTYSQNYKYTNYKKTIKNEIYSSVIDIILKNILIFIIIDISIIIILIGEKRREEKKL